ncbi:ABC transporter substrate-binding protein [Streptomyces sp. NPDC087440]|uniref:ABC transporter substrate-binding protein n=1 Tax=Streptomyces sp. NPDC087440 TaxID=3365790 RepID=UPI003803E698
MKPLRTTVAAALSLLLATTGCAATGGPAPDGDTFTLTTPLAPGALDPSHSTAGGTNLLLSIGYDTLVSSDEKGRTVPGLAEKWRVTPTSVTYTLRKGITCSDGSPLTPSTVAANVAHETAPATRSLRLGVTVPAGLTARADDAAGTVTLATPQPFSFILQTSAMMYLVCGKGLTDRKLLARGMSGSGPYRLVQVQPGDRYSFRLRKDYAWGPGGATSAGMPERLVVQVVANEQTSTNLMVAGAANATFVQGPDRARLKAVQGIRTEEVPTGSELFLFRQSKGTPTADPAVRKALSMALDIEALGKMASGGSGAPPHGMVSEPRPCPSVDFSRYLPPNDLAGAKAVLDAAGWREDAGGVRVKDGRKLSLTLVFASGRGEAAAATAEYAAAEWKRVGADVKLLGLTGGRLADTTNGTLDWDIGALPINVPLPSMLMGVLSGPTPPDGGNFLYLKNQRYEALTGRALGIPGEPGCVLWNKAEASLVEHHDIMPIVDLTTTLATRNGSLRMVPGIVYPTTIRLHTEGK